MRRLIYDMYYADEISVEIEAKHKELAVLNYKN
jgi:hypothetical protein